MTKPNVRLKYERERRGWSQTWVAREIGCDPQSVGRWERGKSFPYPYLRERLCVLFGKDAVELGLVPDNEQGDDIAQPFSLQSRLHHSSQSVAPVYSFPPLSLFDPTIPLPTTGHYGLVGRNMLIGHIKDRLFSGEPGGLTLLRGLPGVGKTALAVAIANDLEIREYFSGGLLWAGAGPSPNISSIVGRWGTLLGCTLPEMEQKATHEDWACAIRTRIGQNPFLFVIDDVWELETILSLRIGGNRCAHLVTTRVPQITYHFSPEEVYTIPELDGGKSLDLLARFVPELVYHHKAASQALVSDVGGLPLALTLVGKHLRAQAATGQPRRLLAALQHVRNAAYRLHLSEPQSPLERHPSLLPDTPPSLETIIALSEQYIGAGERFALRALSYFPAKPNSFSEEFALAIMHSPVEVLDTLTDVGLLESSEPRRYQMHQTIVDYARTRLEQEGQHTQIGQIEQIRDRFVSHIVRFLEEHTNHYNELERESRNSIAALELAWNAETAMMGNAYVRGVVAFTPFLLVRCMYSQARMLLQRAFTLISEDDDEGHMSTILSYLGQIAWEQNHPSEAERYFQEGLERARQQNDQALVCHFLMNLASVLDRRREYEQARRYLQQGFTMAGRLPIAPTFYHRVIARYARNMLCVHFTEPHQMFRHGYLAVIDQFFSTWPLAQAFSPTYMQVVTGPEKQVYGVPVGAYVLCLAYNRQFFREAGLDPDRPPRTWGEFREMAKLLTNPHRGIAGFAEASISNIGGWHFTNWLYTAGVSAQEYRDGIWRATFNHPLAVEFLELLKTMRFHDGSIAHQTLLGLGDAEDMFARGEVAMIVACQNIMEHLAGRPGINLFNIGVAPIPQNGGNACLTGGLAYVFPAGLSSQELKTAFEEVIDVQFDLDDYEASLQAAAAQGKPIGIPQISLFTGEFHRQLEEIAATYRNIPIENYRPYLESTLACRPEPPIEAQRYYALIDPIIQTVLMDPYADPQRLLDQAAMQFQARYLNALSSF